MTTNKRGGQPGNQNARTHGFYSRALTPEQQQELQSAGGLLDLDQEIALVRLKIRSIMADYPDNHAAFLMAVSTLTHMIMINTQFKLRCFAFGGSDLEKIGQEDYQQECRMGNQIEISPVPAVED